MDEAAPAADDEPPSETLGEEIAKQLLEDEEGGPTANDKDEDAGVSKSGKDGEKQPKSAKTLEQMMSLKEGDDERTQISKKVSWILRHGAHKVNIEIDIDGWVTFADLLGSSIMIGVTEEKLMDIINESNQQKVRYELKENDEQGVGGAIRAVSKHTISGMTGTVAREERRAERELRRETRQQERYQERNSGELPRGVDPNHGDDLGAMDPSGQSASWPGGRGGYDDGRQGDDGDLTYEQQLQEGYRPVYQGHRVVAMVKEGGQAVKPGLSLKGGQKGDYKGGSKSYGKGDEKGYDRGGYGGYGNSYGGGGNYHPNDWGSTGGKDRGRGGYRDHNSRNEETFGPQAYGGKGYGGKTDHRNEETFGPHAYGGKDRGVFGRHDHRDYGGKYGGKGYEDAYHDRPRERYPPAGNPRELWRVCEGQEAIMREGEGMESQAMTALTAGTLVYQTGPEVTNQHGIIRMPVETYDTHEQGWVTRTAEAAHGPAFFRREPSDKGARQARKGSKGKGGHDAW